MVHEKHSSVAPAGFASVNPFFVTRDADGLIVFLREVFGGQEHIDVRTVDIDGLLLHAELEIDGTTLMFGERKPDWPFLPQLTQIYVGDVESALARATVRGARIVTRPTDFFGTVFSRMVDPWGNMWWVYQHGEAPELDWSSTEGEADSSPTEWSDPNLAYIHQTLIGAMPSLGTDPGDEPEPATQGSLSRPDVAAMKASGQSH